MAIKVSFFDNTDYDYFASDFNAQFQSIISKSGVSSSGDLTVSQTSPASLGVAVGIGSAWINGMFIQSDAVINLDIPINSSSSARKDYIVLEVDKQNKSAEVKRVASIAFGQLLLATVTMDNTNTAVVQGQITDNRNIAKIGLDVSDVDWGGINNKPNTFPPSNHSHSEYLSTTHPSSSFGYNTGTGRITHNGNDVKVLNSVNAENATKVNNMQVRGGSGLTGASGYITYSW